MPYIPPHLRSGTGAATVPPPPVHRSSSGGSWDSSSNNNSSSRYSSNPRNRDPVNGFGVDNGMRSRRSDGSNVGVREVVWCAWKPSDRILSLQQEQVFLLRFFPFLVCFLNKNLEMTF